ncbi:MAG: hypothetical protein Greene071421_106 [Parcubacteria group bacterium Greene0714_21]|nr:MAG: hypothetical protein Greene041639_245 [Parcubacteria group bacterium Greene0416_39]TSC98508.1 MAG: hypothetical protein Greene101447_10 [Parcubacteria group bacterium Greene1014_47]TSD04270.1 MAG: hypothetical protein Greene071421_106 [Parcubacteria group bacterium Greene0714_21]
MTVEFLLLRILRRQNFQVHEALGVAYGGVEEEFPKEKDLIKAHLVVALLEQCKYPTNAIQVNKFVGTAQGLRETDVLAFNRAKEPFLLAAVEVPQLYEERMEAAMRDLYMQAAPQDQSKSVRWLLYYTRWYATKGVLHKKHIAVDYQGFPTFDSWHAAGSPARSFIPPYA